MERKMSVQEKLPEEKLFLEKAEVGHHIKATKRRWLILILFMYYACVNGFQWIAYCSVTPILVKYYNVSTLAVDWTSVIYMAIYPFLAIPASYIIDRQVRSKLLQTFISRSHHLLRMI